MLWTAESGDLLLSAEGDFLGCWNCLVCEDNALVCSRFLSKEDFISDDHKSLKVSYTLDLEVNPCKITYAQGMLGPTAVLAPTVKPAFFQS